MVDSPPARQHVIEDQAECIDVGALIDVLSARLLRRHVLNRADDGPDDSGRRLGERLVESGRRGEGARWSG